MRHRAWALLAAVVAVSALLGASPSPTPMCDTDASCAALGGAPEYGVTPSTGPVFVAADHTDPAVWDCLRGLGYVGSPLDGVEALYADASDVADCTPRSI